jgi:hypothetical protein
VMKIPVRIPQTRKCARQWESQIGLFRQAETTRLPSQHGNRSEFPGDLSVGRPLLGMSPE